MIKLTCPRSTSCGIWHSTLSTITSRTHKYEPKDKTSIHLYHTVYIRSLNLKKQHHSIRLKIFTQIFYYSTKFILKLKYKITFVFWKKYIFTLFLAKNCGVPYTRWIGILQWSPCNLDIQELVHKIQKKNWKCN